MSTTNTTEADFATLRDDLAGLKSDVAALLGHMKADAGTGAQAAADKVNDGARRLLDTATDQGGASINAISRQIEAQPLAALLIAVGIGWIGGRLLSR